MRRPCSQMAGLPTIEDLRTDEAEEWPTDAGRQNLGLSLGVSSPSLGGRSTHFTLDLCFSRIWLAPGGFSIGVRCVETTLT